MSDLNLFEGYDEVEASSGFDGAALPTGWYPLTVEKVLDVMLTQKASVMARLQVQVFEGEAENKRAFVTMVMAPSSQNTDGSLRSDDEVAKANKNIQGQMKGFLKALGVTTGQPVGATLQDKVASFYNTAQWPGRQFIGKISKQISERYGEQNNLSAYYPLDDEKKGLDWLRTSAEATTDDKTTAATI